ncbi:hypothetical protein SL053_002287 [Flavobacterium psychrophilum]|nr:hypothetical protein [Flavobacterium psychrophilum]
MEKYYFISKKICLDANQWSILLGAIGVLLTLFGFAFAYCIYKTQRNDNAKDAFSFFQDSLPNLKSAIEDTIKNIEDSLKNIENENDDFNNPILSVSLNDKLINRINIIDLNRFYKEKKKTKFEYFRQFLIDADYFGDYHNYFTNEINYFRNNYLEKEKIYSKWQLLRSNKFFSSITDDNEKSEYKKFYVEWVNKLNSDSDVFEMDSENNPLKVKNRTLLVENHIKELAKNVFPFIEFSEKANEINLIANEINSSYADIKIMKSVIINVLKKDIIQFKSILSNLNQIVEDK